jgi:2-oxoglutarate ferredoxin oxidoreductase subunit beta
MQIVYQKPKALTDVPTHYCPGCTHGIIHRLVAEVIDELGVQDKTIGVAPVGCAVLAYNYFNVDMSEASHGRAPAVATGIKRVLPKNIVFTYQGDGDLASIGTAEIVHAATRGENITVIFVNNAIYGMTGGQMAPTTLIGQKATTAPDGRKPERAGYPVRVAEMLSTLDRMDKPTIARVHGPAFAGGTGLVAACDIAVGTPEAKFCFSEAKLGLSPATISPYVMRAIGARAASRYFLTAEVFDAEEALRIGMLSALVPAGGLDAFIESLLKHLLAGGSAAHARIKDLVHDVAGRPIDDELKSDTARRIAEIRASEEGREGIASFLEKRKPKWLSGKS